MSDSSSQPEPHELLSADLDALETAVEAPRQTPAEPEPCEEPIIAFDHVSIAFAHPVLEDVSFEVCKGETLCILGRSGVGKSVALRLLMGFLKPDAGSIRIEGQEITDLGEEGLRSMR